MAPFEATAVWSTSSIKGVKRFVERVEKLKNKLAENTKNNITNNSCTNQNIIHQTIKKVGEDIENFKFNTCVSQLMICLNEFEEKGCDKKELENFMIILAPFAPTLCVDYLKSDWPTYDENKLVANVVNIALQINGKLRATFEAELNAGDEAVKELAKNTEAYKKYISEEKVEIKKIIVVKNKIVNVVV
jgi:leucyl-tRNA synthetase